MTQNLKGRKSLCDTESLLRYKDKGGKHIWGRFKIKGKPIVPLEGKCGELVMDEKREFLKSYFFSVFSHKEKGTLIDYDYATGERKFFRLW